MILLDVMGGDLAPVSPIDGVKLALENEQFKSKIGLVGPKDVIEKELERVGLTNNSRLEIFDASDVITMHDSPTKVLKDKPNSSIAVGLSLHKKGVGKAFISAGNTGAMVAASLFILGRIKGVARPAIGTMFPTVKGSALVLDVGATSDCKPKNLLDFAIMGYEYQKILLDKDPIVGLLSIGEEDSKGSEVVIKAHQLIKESYVNFFGNVEGKDVMTGITDVVVCDGFTGNVILKFLEGFAEMIAGQLSTVLSKEQLYSLMKQYSYENYGGAPLLGVDGISLIGHGKSSPKAIMNGLLNAERLAHQQLTTKIKNAVTNYSEE